jgi:Transposase IS66 family
VSTLADWVGAAAAMLMPLNEAIRTHVFAAERIHADDTAAAGHSICRQRSWVRKGARRRAA